jgi:hypothetical protein
MEEWKVDSTDDAIAATCQKIVSSMPLERLDPMMATCRECIAKQTCGEVVSCIEPMQRDHLQAQKAAENSAEGQ